MKLDLDTQISLINHSSPIYEKDSGEFLCLCDIRSFVKGREWVSIRDLTTRTECSVGFYEKFLPTLLSDGIIEIQDSFLSLLAIYEEIKPKLSENESMRFKEALDRVRK